MESLFTDKGHYTDVADQIDREVIKILEPFFKRWVYAGYSVREISHLINLALFTLELEQLIDWTK